MIKVPLRVSVIALSVTIAAAQYQTKVVRVLPIDSYPASATSSGVTVAADPYPTDEKSFTAFDVRDLNSRGYHPVHVIIANTTGDFLSIKTRNVVLVTSTGQELYTTPATVVVEDIFKGSQATSMKKGSPVVDFTEKELMSREIGPGKVIDGFLFFFSRERNKKFFVGSMLRIPQIMDEDSRIPLGPFLIPIDLALNSQPRPAAKTATPPRH